MNLLNVCIHEHQSYLIPSIHDFYFLNIRDVHRYHTRARSNQNSFFTDQELIMANAGSDLLLMNF